jgi:hypothetical protein
MYGDIDDQVSDIASIAETKGIGHRCLQINQEFHGTHGDQDGFL